jgi:hypothetical protein
VHPRGSISASVTIRAEENHRLGRRFKGKAGQTGRETLELRVQGSLKESFLHDSFKNHMAPFWAGLGHFLGWLGLAPFGLATYGVARSNPHCFHPNGPSLSVGTRGVTQCTNSEPQSSIALIGASLSSECAHIVAVLYDKSGGISRG